MSAGALPCTSCQGGQSAVSVVLARVLSESSAQLLAGPAIGDAFGQNFFVEGVAEEPPAASSWSARPLRFSLA